MLNFWLHLMYFEGLIGCHLLTVVSICFRTVLGRSRAWLRLALMQKRLSDYFRILVEQKDSKLWQVLLVLGF